MMDKARMAGAFGSDFLLQALACVADAGREVTCPSEARRVLSAVTTPIGSPAIAANDPNDGADRDRPCCTIVPFPNLHSDE